jgi:hypothetical protein
VGFEFDTVETQFNWARNALEMGYGRFWVEYEGFFDYLPGALLLIMSFAFIANFFDTIIPGDNAQAFVTVMKLFNIFADLQIAFVCFYYAKLNGASKLKALFISTLFFAMPSFWFVSNIWGQFDSFVVLLGLLSIVLMYLGARKSLTQKNIFKNLSFWSGVFFALGFWLKPLVLLTLPLILIFYLTRKDNLEILKNVKNQFFGFVFCSFLIIALPMFYNPGRVGQVLLLPFTKENVVSNGAATFWALLGFGGDAGKVLIGFEGFGLSISLLGVLVFSLIMACIYLNYQGIRIRDFFVENFKIFEFWDKCWKRKLTLGEFSLLMTILGGAYFLFMTKMHSRYLIWSLVFGFISFAIFSNTKYWKKSLLSILIINLGYFLNQLKVYADWNNNILWVDFIVEFLDPILMQLSAFLILIGFIGFIYINLKKLDFYQNK